MTDRRPSSEHHQRREDAHELNALGYAQELFRTMGGFSNFAISFSIGTMLARMFLCVSTTPLGSAVAPEVKMISAVV